MKSRRPEEIRAIQERRKSGASGPHGRKTPDRYNTERTAVERDIMDGEGYVKFADSSVFSLECFEGNHDACPDELDDGYICECAHHEEEDEEEENGRKSSDMGSS